MKREKQDSLIYVIVFTTIFLTIFILSIVFLMSNNNLKNIERIKNLKVNTNESLIYIIDKTCNYNNFYLLRNKKIISKYTFYYKTNYYRNLIVNNTNIKNDFVEFNPNLILASSNTNFDIYLMTKRISNFQIVNQIYIGQTNNNLIANYISINNKVFNITNYTGKQLFKRSFKLSIAIIFGIIAGLLISFLLSNSITTIILKIRKK